MENKRGGLGFNDQTTQLFKRTMKGLILKNIYWIYLNRLDENISKAPRLEIADCLADQNFSVTLLTGFRKKIILPKKYRLKVFYFNGFHIKGLFKLFLSINIFLWLIRNVQIYDIVIMPPGSLWMSRPLQIIKNCWVHLDIRTIPVEINDIKSRIEYFLYWHLPIMIFHRFPDSYSFITELLKKNVEKEFNICFEDYVVWHSGVNVDHFEIVRKHKNRVSDKLVITYLGVLTQNRGIDIVLSAISKLDKQYKQKIIFQVIGDGPYLETLRQLSHKFGINKSVVYNGQVPYERVPEHLISSDCFICPLPNRTEWNVSSPIKIFEYLACAKPIILTPIPAHKNIVNSCENIVWTDGYDVSAFVKALEYTINNIEKLTFKSEIAYDNFKENYEWKTQSKVLAKYFTYKYAD